MGIFKLFQGSIHIKKLFLGLKNIKLYLASKLLYQLPISGATATCGTVTYNGNKQIAQDINVNLSGYTLVDDYDYTVISNSGGTNAGSYQFTVSGINYFNSSVNGTFTINPKTVNSPTITLDPSSYTYSGSQCKPTPTVKDGSTTIASSEYTVSYTNNINAGTATCTITDKSGGNYTVSGSKTFTISKADITPTVSIENWTYGGTASNPSVVGNSGGGTVTYYYKLTSASSWSTTKPSNAGNYNIRADIAATTNYNSGSCTNNFTIGKADPSYNAPTAKSLTYNGSAQALLNAGSVTGGTIYYSSDNSTWVTTIPSGTNATSYTSYWKITGDSNHKDKASASITTTINKASGSVSTKPTAKSLTYNNSDQALVNAGSGTGTMLYVLSGSTSWSTSIPTGKNAGDYTVCYKASASTNYNESASGSVSVNIAKVTPTVAAPTANTLTYNGNPQTLAKAGSTNWGTLQYSLDGISYATSVPSSTNAGSYTVYYKVVGNININDVAPKTVSVTIAKANPTYTAPTAKSLTYNGSAQALLNAGSTSHGTIQYSSDNSSWSTTIPSQTNANTYSAYWRLLGDSNHNDVASTKISNITISKVTPTVTVPTPKTLTFNTTNQVLANAGSTDFGTMQYCLNNSGGTYSTTVPSASAANTTYKVWYKVVGNSNVNDVAPASIDCMIAEKRVTTPTIVLDPSSYTYNGSAKEPTVTVKDGSTVIPASEYTKTFSNNVNAGTATVTITDNTAGNYYISGTTTFTISKVTPTVNAPTAKGLTYNGNPQALVNAGSTNFGSLQYSTTSGGTYSTTIPTQTNAGSYEVWYKVIGDSNVNSTNPTKVACSISKAAGTATVAGTSNTYNGSAKSLVTVSNNTGTMHYKVDSGGWTTNIPQATNAGSWTIYWYMDESSNYTGIASANTRYVSSTINKAAMTYTAPKAAARTYNGNAQEIVSGASAAGGSIYYATSSAGASSSTTVPTQVNASTTYSTWWKAVPDSNHSGGTSSWAQITGCTINKANQSAPTATGATTTYHNTATATADGGGGIGTLTWTNGNTRTATGTTTTAAYWSGDSNYNASPNSNSVNLVVNKATDQSITVTTTNRTYNGSGQVVASATAHGITNYYLGFGSSSTSAPTSWGAANSSISQTNAGTYYVWYKGTADGNHSGDIGATYKGTVTIGKADQSAPTATGATTTYPTTASATAGGGGGQGPIEWESTQSQTSVGSHTTRARWSGNSNYNASPWSNSVTVQMNKAAGSVTINGVSLTYNGSARNLVTVSNNTGTMHYSTNGTSWVTTIPTATNANSYTVYWYMDASTNYEGISSASSRYVSSTIGKADQSAPTATGATTTYPTTASATAGGGGGQGPIEWESAQSQTSVGSHTTRARWSGNSNYNASPWSSSVTVQMNKAAGSVTTAPVNNNYTYNGTARAVASAGSGTGTMYYRLGSSGSFSTTMPTMTNAGSNTLYYYAAASTNYEQSSTGSITVSVQKASQSAPTATVTTATYPSTSTASASGGGGQGTLTWTNGSSRSAVGSQDTYAYWAGNSNYNASPNSNKVTLSVAKFTPTVTLTATDRAYNGNPLYATASVATPSGGKTMKGAIYYGTSSGAQTYSATYTGGSVNLSSVSVTNVGSATVYAYFVPDSTCNDVYNNSGNASKTFSVSKANQSAPTATGATVTYHNTATATASGGGGQGTLTWTNGNTRTATGSQDTYAYWAGNSNYNASPNSNKVTLTVNKATDQSITVTLTDRTYNTSGQVVASATSHGCTYYLGFGSSSTSAPTSWGAANSSISQTNAGTYYVWYKGTADANHSADIGATYKGTVTISKADQGAPTATGATSTYPTGATATASGGGGVGTLTWTNGSSRSSCGSQNTKAYWAGNSNYNASPYSNEVTITVNKGACPSYTAPTAKTGLVYNGSSQTLYNAGSSSNGTFSYSNGTRTNAGSQTVSWTFTPTDSCRNGASGSFSVTIAQKAISIPTPTSVSRAYNGNAATATFGAATGASITKYRYSTNGSSWTESSTNPSQTNAGTLYTQAYYKANDSNYSGENWTSSATIAISKASQSAPTATGATTTYNTTATATASGGGGQGSLEWSNGNTQTSVGSKTTKARWSGNNNYNASDWSNEVTVKMNKAAGSVSTAPTNSNPTYGSGNYLCTTGSGTGTMLYKLGSSGTYSTTRPTTSGLNAGTYTLYYKASASTNYNESSEGSITVTVAKASQSAPTATGATVCYGNTATASASGGGGVGTLTWTNGNTRTSIGTTATAAYWSGNSNYNASPNSNSVNLVVENKWCDGTTWVNTLTWPSA